MAGMQKVMIIGNLGKDPEVKNISSNSKVAKFPVAVSEKYKDKDGNIVETTEWFDCEVWNGQADVCEKYLKKGSQVYIEGKQKTDKWQDEAGNNKYTKKLRISSFTMLGSKPTSSNNQGESYSQPDISDDGDDVLPF